KFNQDKATKLEDIQVKGKEKAMKIKDLEEMVEAFEKQKLDINSAIGKLEKGIADLDESIAQIQTEIKSIKDDQTPFEDTELGQKLTKEGKDIQAKIDAGDANHEDDIELLNEKIDIVKAELLLINDDLYKFTTYANQYK